MVDGIGPIKGSFPSFQIENVKIGEVTSLPKLEELYPDVYKTDSSEKIFDEKVFKHERINMLINAESRVLQNFYTAAVRITQRYKNAATDIERSRLERGWQNLNLACRDKQIRILVLKDALNNL